MNISECTSLYVRGAALVGLVFLFSACELGLTDKPSKEIETESALTRPGPIRVRRDRFTRQLLLSGELAAARSVKIEVPPSLGRGPFLIKTLVPEGTQVQPGDLLIQLDNSSRVGDLENENLNLDKAENEVVRRESELEAQLKEYEIQAGRAKLEWDKAQLKAAIPKELLATRDWAEYQFVCERAKKEYEKIARGLDLSRKAAEEEVKLLRLRKTQISSQISRLQQEIAAMEIRATRAGTVLYALQNPSQADQNASPWKLRQGDLAYWGMTLINIPDLSEMEVRVLVSEVDAGAVHAGMTARIIPDAYPHSEYYGVLDRLPEIAVRSGKHATISVFPTRITLTKTDPTVMKPGISVRAEITLEEQDGLVLPRQAVFTENGRSFTRLTSGAKREIKVRARNPTHCLIEGLTEGVEVLP
jgi:HlyD family secretion protein